MTAIQSKCLTVLLVAFCLITDAVAQENPMQFLSRANAKVAKAAALKTRWEGPVDGPKLLKKKKIVFIASDLSDPSISGLFNGVKEAINGAGWEILYIDCRGRCNQGAAIVSQALDMSPNGIILAGVDAAGQAKGLAAAAHAKVPVVGWHASIKSGPADGLFTNITSNPKEAAQIAALYGVVESNSKAGIVVFSDTSNPYSVAKSNAIVEVIKQCESCRLLSVEDVPVAEANTKMLHVVENLTKKFGAKWTHAIGVNDVYFDLMERPAIAALISTNKVSGLSAGDGSSGAFKRIRASSLQIGTVPEPLLMHGWQLVDELNRAFSDVAPSGYVTPVHLVTAQNIAYDGGPKNVFDPGNDYRSQYQRIWAK
ncbi:substrate-binding domain-containing protein [Undibacterium sp. Jales W-56]|uniref:substrate-binding domain-containing protein n=1 Tax=Undibacterium sp. Jales W-56 TaxID=2897325 RepID=UPI0021D32333|nr:substrate-binding domain-containing protein [Undibacterium sp. Jales W-56]MCU6434062.1 substrate-binding domain-containing protein [Undibacterium sp. Jales W-56]